VTVNVPPCGLQGLRIQGHTCVRQQSISSISVHVVGRSVCLSVCQTTKLIVSMGIIAIILHDSLYTSIVQRQCTGLKRNTFHFANTNVREAGIALYDVRRSSVYVAHLKND